MKRVNNGKSSLALKESFKEWVPKINFLISQPKHMLWVLKRLTETVLLRTQYIYIKTDGQETIYNFTPQNFVYLNLWFIIRQVMQVFFKASVILIVQEVCIKAGEKKASANFTDEHWLCQLI